MCNSNYQALTGKVERRSQNGIAIMIAYTFTKWMDNTSWSTVGAIAPAVQDINNRIRSLSPNHSPHRLVFAPIVELPFGRGKPLLNRGGFVNALVGGWQISTVGTLQSGFPLTATVLNGARDIKGDPAPGSVLWPHIVADANSANQGQPAAGVVGVQWLTESAFAVPERFTLGNLGRVIPGVLSPGMVSFDSMIAKEFRFSERYRVQFRWEAFNTFNTPQWGTPNSDVGGGNFGVVTGASGRRIMQFGAKLYW